MTICATAGLAIIGISFNGTNLAPIAKKTKFKLGGVTYTDGPVDTAGRHYPVVEMMAGELTTSVPLNGEFSIDALRGVCGDLIVLTSTGKSYLSTNATLLGDPEYNDDGGAIETKFKGDAFVEY